MEKVEQFYNKNQFLIKGDNGVTFQSYASIIANIDGGNLTLYSDWKYSRTTLKHLYLFLREYVYRLTASEKKEELKKVIYYSKNIKKDIQKLIDKKIIKYVEA